MGGAWYSSIFTHYYPTDWKKDIQMDEIHYAVPPHWRQEPDYETDHVKLVMSGTSMKEPECENVWCGLENSVKWYGPAIEGEIITTGWKNSTVVKEEVQEELTTQTSFL